MIWNMARDGRSILGDVGCPHPRASGPNNYRLTTILFLSTFFFLIMNHVCWSC
jgi:hypothetical protein